jgi:myo-inositol catabolism protein IolC
VALGYDGILYILAFDHRGSFEKGLLGIEGEPTPEQAATISDAKHLIYEGMVAAVERGGAPPHTAGVLVDEQFGAPAHIQRDAKAAGMKLAMPVERSGQELFDFEYGDDFARHILEFDPDFTKVLVRYNPDHDAAENTEQLGRLKQLADWLHAHDRLFLFELLVPAEPAQLASVAGDGARYDDELRPELTRRAIEAIQDFGIEVDIWKIEGVDAHEDAERLAAQTRHGPGREHVVCILLGRGASEDQVDHWLRTAAPVPGFIGFAIGRSIWWDALHDFLAGSTSRAAARDQIADRYLRFRAVYEAAAAGDGA